MKLLTALALALLAAILLTACTDAQAREVQQIEQQYGVSGVYTGSVATDDGAAKGTLVQEVVGRQGGEGRQCASEPSASACYAGGVP